MNGFKASAHSLKIDAKSEFLIRQVTGLFGKSEQLANLQKLKENNYVYRREW